MAYRDAVLALSPNSFWMLNESSGTTFADIGSDNKPLTLAGSAFTRGEDTLIAGVGAGINFGSSRLSWAITTSPLTQVVSNKFSICGWYLWSAFDAFSDPIFCASFSGGHVTPFYIFLLCSQNNTGASNWRIAIDTTGAFAPLDTSIATMTNNVYHHVAMTYDGTTTKLYIDSQLVVSSGAITGNTHDTMGSFALNNIPALNSSGNAAFAKAAAWAYWANTTLTPTDVSTLYAAGIGEFQLPVSVSSPLRT